MYLEFMKFGKFLNRKFIVVLVFMLECERIFSGSYRVGGRRNDSFMVLKFLIFIIFVVLCLL